MSSPGRQRRTELGLPALRVWSLVHQECRRNLMRTPKASPRAGDDAGHARASSKPTGLETSAASTRRVVRGAGRSAELTEAALPASRRHSQLVRPATAENPRLFRLPHVCFCAQSSPAVSSRQVCSRAGRRFLYEPPRPVQRSLQMVSRVRSSSCARGQRGARRPSRRRGRPMPRPRRAPHRHQFDGAPAPPGQELSADRRGPPISTGKECGGTTSMMPSPPLQRLGRRYIRAEVDQQGCEGMGCRCKKPRWRNRNDSVQVQEPP